MGTETAPRRPLAVQAVRCRSGTMRWAGLHPHRRHQGLRNAADVQSAEFGRRRSAERCNPQTRAYGRRRHMPRRPIGWGIQQPQETGAHALQPHAGEPGRGCARLAGAQQAHCRQQGHATAAPMAPKRDRRPALTEGYPAVQPARLQRRYSACLAPRRRSSSDHRSFRKSRSGKTAVQGFVNWQ